MSWAFSNSALAGAGPASAATQRRDLLQIRCRFSNEQSPTQRVVVVRVGKSTARADGLTDEEIEAELAGYNAERRL